MKRILQISKYYYPFIGGVEQVVRDMANAFKSYDVEQKIICFNEDAKLDGYICHKEDTVHEIVDGIEVIRCGYKLKYASQSISLPYIKELDKVMKEFDPDIVILHYPNPYVSALLRRYYNRKFKLFLYWHLDITKQKFLGKLFHGQNKSLIKRAEKIIGATPVHVNESAYSPYFGDKKYILPYQIDERRLVLSDEEKNAAAELRERYKGKTLGFFIGRHVPYKGLKHLIEASALLGRDDFHFFIAGNGELTEDLKKQAEGDNKVEFVGRVTDSEMRIYLYACDIFCFPSVTRNEAFGLAQAEAMYYRKPVITFTIPGSGVNFVNLDGVTGIECPNGDSKAYADALIKLADDPELRAKYGENGRQRVLDNFTLNAFVKNVGRLIETTV